MALNLSSSAQHKRKPSNASRWIGKEYARTDRYHHDFEELEHIGKGGFGDVLKVRNKIDDRTYAIKKIQLKVFKSKILDEVKTLSRLFHKNVVRYYQAWIEEETINTPVVFDTNNADTGVSLPTWGLAQTGSSDSDSEVIGNHKFQQSDHENSPFFGDDDFDSGHSFSVDTTRNSVDMTKDGDDLFSGHFGQLECQECIGTYTDWFVDDKYWEKLPMAHRHLKLCEVCFKKQLRQCGFTDYNLIKFKYQKARKDGPVRYLFIQMEYCEGTLRETIDKHSLFEDVDKAWRIFGQVVEGLAYIHSQGIVHRDLKPGNIFLDKEGNVKIGDFGLATSIVRSEGLRATHEDIRSESDETDDSETSSSSNAAVGTALYSSPETGRGDKCDMYSLGIILFEMVYRFKTAMERVLVIKSIRKFGTYPSDFVDNPKFEQQRKVVTKLVQRKPNLRPSALDLLNSQLLPPSALPDEGLEKMLDKLTMPQSVSFVRVMDSLFSAARNDALKQNLLSQGKGKDPSEHLSAALDCYEDTLRREDVVNKMKAVFKAHGSTMMSTSWIDEDLNDVWHTPDKAEVLFSAGTLLTMPVDLRTGFAKFIAQINYTGQARTLPTTLKRFHVGPIYRKSAKGSAWNLGYPAEIFVADFDIVIQQDLKASKLGSTVPTPTASVRTSQDQVAPSPIRISTTYTENGNNIATVNNNSFSGNANALIPFATSYHFNELLKKSGKWQGTALAPCDDSVADKKFGQALSLSIPRKPTSSLPIPPTKDDSSQREYFSCSLPVTGPADAFATSDTNTEVIVAEAECIRVVVELIGKFEWIPSYYILISDMHFNQALMSVCGIDDIDKDGIRNLINRIVSTAPQVPWSTIVTRLKQEALLDENVVDTLRRFFLLKGNPKQVLTDLASLFSSFQTSHPDAHRKVTKAIHHLHRLLQALDDFMIPSDRISFDCSVALTEYSSGINFKVFGVLGEKKRPSLLAIGGRFDNQIEYFEQVLKRKHDPEFPLTPREGLGAPSIITTTDPTERKKFRAVGLTWSVEKLLFLMKHHASKDDVRDNAKSFDVFVVSPPSLFSERMQMTARLWQEGISADFLRNKSAELPQQKVFARKVARHIVELDEKRYYSDGCVKVIQPGDKATEIHRTRIATFLGTLVSGFSPNHSSVSPATSTNSVHHYAVPTKPVVIASHSHQPRHPQQIRANYFNSLGLPIHNVQQ